MLWFNEVMDNFFKGLKLSFDFTGSSTRKEFWHFTIISILLNIALGIIDYILFGNVFASETAFISLIYSMLIFVPSISIAVRRFHDMGYTGWFVLGLVIPIVNLIVLAFLFFKGGDVDLPMPSDYKK